MSMGWGHTENRRPMRMRHAHDDLRRPIDMPRHGSWAGGSEYPQMTMPTSEPAPETMNPIIPMVIASIIGLSAYAAERRRNPSMPPMPNMPSPETVVPSKLSPESKLAKLQLGTESSNKAALKRGQRKRRLSMAHLDLSEDDAEILGARNVRSF